MTYAFPPELDALVREELATGRYASADELLTAAVQTLRERELLLASLRDDLRIRLKRLDQGEGIVFENADQLREYFDDIQRVDKRELTRSSRDEPLYSCSRINH
jgi:putative addiction module CopG family antidote